MTRGLILALLLLTGCASTRREIVEQADSVSHAATQRDSVSQRDSIYIYRSGDTLLVYKERQVVKWRERVDTIHREKVATDTVYRERVQVLSAPAGDPVKWYDRGFIWVGRLCLIALIIWVIFLYIKRKV